MPGRTCSHEALVGDGRSISAPTAHISGPTVIGIRGPIRVDSVAARDDRNSSETVIGKVDRPASSAFHPAAWSWSTVNSETAPYAP